MDIISHVLISSAIAGGTHQDPTAIYWFMIYSVFPDIMQIPLYLYVGYKNKRPLLVPRDKDWYTTDTNKIRKYLYDIPHSFFFLLLLTPFTIIFRLPMIALFGYGLHIVLDMMTHKGQWRFGHFIRFKKLFMDLQVLGVGHGNILF